MHVREKLRSGLVIPAHPLALNPNASWMNAVNVP